MIWAGSSVEKNPGYVYIPTMETSQQRFPKDPAGKEAQLVQDKRYHQEVPSWPQYLLTHPQVSQFPYHTGLHAERQTGCTRPSSWTPHEPFHLLHHEEPQSGGVWLPSQPPGRSPVSPAHGPPSPNTDLSFGQWSLQEHPHSGIWIPCPDHEICRESQH